MSTEKLGITPEQQLTRFREDYTALDTLHTSCAEQLVMLSQQGRENDPSSDRFCTTSWRIGVGGKGDDMYPLAMRTSVRGVTPPLTLEDPSTSLDYPKAIAEEGGLLLFLPKGKFMEDTRVSITNVQVDFFELQPGHQDNHDTLAPKLTGQFGGSVGVPDPRIAPVELRSLPGFRQATIEAVGARGIEIFNETLAPCQDDLKRARHADKRSLSLYLKDDSRWEPPQEGPSLEARATSAEKAYLFELSSTALAEAVGYVAMSSKHPADRIARLIKDFADKNRDYQGDQLQRVLKSLSPSASVALGDKTLAWLDTNGQSIIKAYREQMIGETITHMPAYLLKLSADLARYQKTLTILKSAAPAPGVVT